MSDSGSKVLLLAAKKGIDKDFEKRIEETIALIEACDLNHELTLTQAMEDKAVSTYVKQGKLEEVITAVEALSIDYVLTLDELSPSQHRNLDEVLEAEVIDRTQLILMIFEKRAQSSEAKLQVQAATLSYLLPRMALQHGSVGRQQGGKARTKGSGEQALALRKRVTERQLHRVLEQLNTVQLARLTQGAKRRKQEVFTIALVGYTNAGKSSLLNALMNVLTHDPSKQVSAKNRLFETLSTASRKVNLKGLPLVLIDTVGFVSHLPHTLVKAFRSTLEEVLNADLLIHVIDGSSDEAMRQSMVTLETLEEIGCHDKPMITVYNKADLKVQPGLSISAKTGLNLDKLQLMIERELHKLKPKTQFFIPFDEPRVLAALKHHFPTCSIRETEAGYKVTLPYEIECPDEFKPYLGQRSIV